MKRRACAGIGDGSPAASSNSAGVLDEALCQCPVCLDVMLGKILMCPGGHGICGDTCFTTLPQPKLCPQCRTAYGPSPTRGLMVEQMIAALTWTCKHGCGLACTGAEMSKHLAHCPNRPVTCPVCEELVHLRAMAKHFADKTHQYYAIKEPVYRTTSDLWEAGDESEYSHLRLCFVNQANGDVAVVAIHFPALGVDRCALIRAYHCLVPWQCKVVFGGPARRATFDLESCPMQDFKAQEFGDDDRRKGLEISFASARTFVQNGIIPFAVEVRPGQTRPSPINLERD